MDIVVIIGSLTPPGRFNKAVGWMLEEAKKEFPEVNTELIHLRDYKVSMADGRPLSDYGDDTEKVITKVMEADGVIFATPIYRAAPTAALKNLLDQTPPEGLAGKPVGLLSIGARETHYLAMETMLRPVLTWFGAMTLPVAAFLRNDMFKEGEFADPDGQEELRNLFRTLVTVTKATAGVTYSLKSLPNRILPPHVKV